MLKNLTALVFGITSASASVIRKEVISGSRVRSQEDPSNFYLVENGSLVNLLETMEDKKQYFPLEFDKEVPFPQSFTYPQSYEYTMHVGQMAITKPQAGRVF